VSWLIRASLPGTECILPLPMGLPYKAICLWVIGHRHGMPYTKAMRPTQTDFLCPTSGSLACQNVPPRLTGKPPCRSPQRYS
jgi:hypothetical protein